MEKDLPGKDYCSKDVPQSNWVDEAYPVAVDFAKTAGLFMRGKAGIALTIASYAAGEATVADKPSNLAELGEDIVRGGLKGSLMKASFWGLNHFKLGAAGNGVLLGASSRLFESSLSRSTYQMESSDSQTKNYWIKTGAVKPLDKIIKTTFDPGAMVSDAAIFMAAHGLLKGINSTTIKSCTEMVEGKPVEIKQGLIGRPPFLAVSLTGATFGFTSGSASELMRQHQGGESLDVSKAIISGVQHGALDALAAMPGALQVDQVVSREMARLGNRAIQEAKWYYWKDIAKIKPRELGLIVPESITTSEPWLNGVEAVQKLRAAGYEAFFVGGCVRDILIDKVPKDYDVVTNATPSQVEKIFPDGKFAGKKFGVMHANVSGEEIEIATFRADGNYSDARRPDSVTRLNKLPVRIAMREDAGRRDLTINSMYFDPISRIAYYYFDGPSDLIANRIDTVGNPRHRFKEDPSRLLRIATFTSKLGASPTYRVIEAMMQDAKSIHTVPHELWGQEMNKILLSKDPVRGLKLLKKTGILAQMVPELERLDSPDGDQDPRFHPEGNTWIHSCMVTGEAAKNPNRTLALMWSALLHDIGKPDTQVKHPDGKISNHQHDRIGAPIARKIMRRFCANGDDEKETEDNVASHMSMHMGEEMTSNTLYRYLSKYNIVNLIELQHADSVGRGKCCTTGDDDENNAENFGSLREFWYQKFNESKGTTQAIDAKPILDGRTLISLGFKEGKQLGAIKEASKLAQFEGKFVDLEGAIKWLGENYTLPENRQ